MTDWSKRTVSDKLDVKGKSIDRLVSWYFKNEIWVNRRYQRKLVWTKKDKNGDFFISTKFDEAILPLKLTSEKRLVIKVNKNKENGC